MKYFRKLLFPFSILYGVILCIRNFLYDIDVFKSKTFKTPTIVVGNLSLGGTGKTPQIEYLIRLVKDDYKIAVLSRGYKRKGSGFLIANNDSSAETIGDEPFQYYSKFPGITVCVDEKRANGILQLESLQNPPEIILLDDAYQHRKVRGGMNILLTTYNDLFVDDCILPSGNLREPRNGAKRAQIIVVSKCPKDISLEKQQEIIKKIKPNENQSVFFTTISYDNALKGSFEIDLKEVSNNKVLLVTGIANPKPLTAYLESQKIDFEHLKYPDHYDFKSRDISKINKNLESFNSKKSIILTTEKDYVRIFEKLEKVYYISIRTTFVNYKSDFDKKIKDYVEQSSRNS